MISSRAFRVFGESSDGSARFLTFRVFGESSTPSDTWVSFGMLLFGALPGPLKLEAEHATSIRCVSHATNSFAPAAFSLHFPPAMGKVEPMLHIC